MQLPATLSLTANIKNSSIVETELVADGKIIERQSVKNGVCTFDIDGKDLLRSNRYKNVILVTGYNSAGYVEGKEYITVRTNSCEHSDIVLVSAKAATCSQKGNIAYYECQGCGEYFKNAPSGYEVHRIRGTST